MSVRVHDISAGPRGLKLNAQSRAALMARLSESNGAGLTAPKSLLGSASLAAAAAAAANATKVTQPLSSSIPQASVLPVQGVLGPASPIPTSCLLLKNLFDPAEYVFLGSLVWCSSSPFHASPPHSSRAGCEEMSNICLHICGFDESTDRMRYTVTFGDCSLFVLLCVSTRHTCRRTHILGRNMTIGTRIFRQKQRTNALNLVQSSISLLIRTVKVSCT